MHTLAQLKKMRHIAQKFRLTVTKVMEPKTDEDYKNIS